MNEPVLLPFREQARDLIQEGDVFLFRGTGFVSYCIQKFTAGEYSHVGLASWHYNDEDILELIEFREWKGGRTTSFEQALKLYDKQIDVYRICSPSKVLYYDEDYSRVREKWLWFPDRDVTQEMRKLTGLPYGFKRIWWIWKFYAFGMRFLLTDKTAFLDETQEEVVYPVCSTAVAACFSRFGFDLVKNCSDERTTPNDIARSPALSYLFTPFVDF